MARADSVHLWFTISSCTVSGTKHETQRRSATGTIEKSGSMSGPQRKRHRYEHLIHHAVRAPGPRQTAKQATAVAAATVHV
jgi:hypothetical protein